MDGRRYRHTSPFIRRGACAIPGRFQPYSHTEPDRYPWLFNFAREALGAKPDLRILSFGCSTGAEVFALRRFFPVARIKGVDINPLNIARCRVRAIWKGMRGLAFTTASSVEREPADFYDAIFCLAVLCHGDLTVSGTDHCDPLLYFGNFESIVTDFSRCLKPDGLLFLLTTNFRFCDTAISRQFDCVLAADAAQLAPDVLFDRNNRLMKGVRYPGVAFRKRATTAGTLS